MFYSAGEVVTLCTINTTINNQFDMKKDLFFTAICVVFGILMLNVHTYFTYLLGLISLCMALIQLIALWQQHRHT